MFRSVLLALVLLVGLSRSGETRQTADPEARLRLYHTHTGERIDVVYRRGAHYVPSAIAALDRFLRDHRTGDIHQFDPRLYDLLSELTAAVDRAGAEIAVVCGYRTPRSNEYLRRHTSGVAKSSLHMRAAAIDIRLPGTRTAVVRRAAIALGRGGVGYYPASDFIHVDIGRVRYW